MRVVTGDITPEEWPWLAEACAATGLALETPLATASPDDDAAALLDFLAEQDVEATVAGMRAEHYRAGFLGRPIGRALLAEHGLDDPAAFHPCGERGEYHTVVTAYRGTRFVDGGSGGVRARRARRDLGARLARRRTRPISTSRRPRDRAIIAWRDRRLRPVLPRRPLARTRASTGGSSPPSRRPASTAGRAARRSRRSARTCASCRAPRPRSAPASAPASAAGPTPRPARRSGTLRADVGRPRDAADRATASSTARASPGSRDGSATASATCTACSSPSSAPARSRSPGRSARRPRGC